MYQGLGTSYHIGTNLPLMQSFTVDLPVAEMTEEAMGVVRAEVKEMLPWIALGAVVAGFAGAAIANFIVPGGRRT